jgi:hypothetical protein
MGGHARLRRQLAAPAADGPLDFSHPAWHQALEATRTPVDPSAAAPPALPWRQRARAWWRALPRRLWTNVRQESARARIKAGCRLSLLIAITTPLLLSIPLRWLSGWLLQPAYRAWWAQQGVPTTGGWAVIREAARWCSVLPPVHLALLSWELTVIWRTTHPDGRHWSPAFVSAMAITPICWWLGVVMLLMAGPHAILSVWACVCLLVPYAIMRTWMDWRVAGMLDSTQQAARMASCR